MVQQKKRSRTLIALMGVLAITAGVLTATSSSVAPAQALDLPTWADVEAAKQNQGAASAKVTEIENLIVQVKQEVATTKSEADRTQSAFVEAEYAFIEAKTRYEDLAKAAEDSRAEAETTAEQAAVLAAQMYRSGGVDQSVELFLDETGETADVLLEKLAMMSKATERSTTLYEDALQAQNNATSLGEQAEIAKAELEGLKDAAEKTAQAAQVAAQSAQVKLTDSEAQEQLLEAQLAALKDETATTVAGYEKRLAIEAEERRKAEEAARKAAEEAARLAWEQQQNNNNNGGGGGTVTPPTGGGGNVGSGNGSGWVRPSGGYVSSHYSGNRPACNNGYCTYAHTGTDLAAGMGTAIVAATSGTVALSGWVGGGGGNMVYINHNGGLQTRYAHMSAIYVSPGQWVNTGQVIGLVGSTGNSSGPHLHFEVLVGGGFVDPYYFMGDRGIWF